MSSEVDSIPEVLIVGAGPVGLMTAILLAHQGLRSVVVERFKTRHGAPKAHALNPRSLEICRCIGIDVAALTRRATPRQDSGWVRFVTKLTGCEIGVLPYERQDSAVTELTPTPLINLAQPLFEDALLDVATNSALIQIRRGFDWISCREDGNGVASVVEDVETRERTTLMSRFLIGADGAGSAVRRQLGVSMIGDDVAQSFITIHFGANLRSLLEQRPGILYWIMQPPHTGVLIAYDIDREWCLLYPHDPAVMPREAFTRDVCTDILRHVIGSAVPDIEIKHVLPWVMISEVAERYRQESIFLVGDAAHRFPPMGGLGLNTGLQDAHNLVWKIAAVKRHGAPEALLDTYETERRAVARTNAAQSHKNAQRILHLQASLRSNGTDSPEALHQRLSDPVALIEIKQQIANQREHFDSLALQLGFSYGPGAPDAGDISNFKPKLRVGSRLPHVWLSRGGQTISSLDLIDYRSFTLIIGAPLADGIVVPTGPMAVHVCAEGANFQDPSGAWTRFLQASEGKGVLVRPDGHVAAILRGEDSYALSTALATSLETAFTRGLA